MRAWLAATVAGLASGCAAPLLPPCGLAAPPGFVAWVVDHGYHTEIAIPAGQATGPLAALRAMFPDAQTLSFGFGKQDFMTQASTGLADLVAGILPGAGTVRVSVQADPAQARATPTIQVPLSAAEWAALSGFLWASVSQPDGSLVPVMAEPGVVGRFFASVTGYSLAYTCNTWTVDALQRTGFEVGGPVVFSGGAMREAATISAACAVPR